MRNTLSFECAQCNDENSISPSLDCTVYTAITICKCAWKKSAAPLVKRRRKKKRTKTNEQARRYLTSIPFDDRATQPFFACISLSGATRSHGQWKSRQNTRDESKNKMKSKSFAPTEKQWEENLCIKRAAHGTFAQCWLRAETVIKPRVACRACLDCTTHAI